MGLTHLVAIHLIPTHFIGTHLIADPPQSRMQLC
jgi:hypothetical protein